MRKFIKNITPHFLKSFYHFLYAWLGAVWYRHPSEQLFVIGVTGTTGKSSTVYWLRQVLEAVGIKVGSLSTIDFYVAGEQKFNNRKMTMLGKMEIQRYLRKMVEKKCDVAIVEMTSEGAVQHRHRFINVDLMVLTTLYPEHIESHGSFENYKKAKLKIFEYVSKQRRKRSKEIAKFGNLEINELPKIVLVNGNNEHAKDFLAFPFDKKYAFAQTGETLSIEKDDVENIFLTDHVNATRDGLSFSVSGTDYAPKIYGKYNAMNLTTVIAVASILGITKEKILQAVNDLRGVPGRIEFIPEAEKLGFQVIVDYAFEPVALAALYDVVRILQPKRVLHVGGATGGGRDKARRIPMGRMVGEKADLVFVTDDDPYDEDPLEIIKMVSRGAQEKGKKLGENLWEITDRREAIQKAVSLAQPGDIVLITGKGSEQAMCLAKGLVPWDDRDEVRRALAIKH